MTGGSWRHHCDTRARSWRGRRWGWTGRPTNSRCAFGRPRRRTKPHFATDAGHIDRRDGISRVDLYFAAYPREESCPLPISSPPARSGVSRLRLHRISSRNRVLLTSLGVRHRRALRGLKNWRDMSFPCRPVLARPGGKRPFRDSTPQQDFEFGRRAKALCCRASIRLARLSRSHLTSIACGSNRRHRTNGRRQASRI